MTETLGEGESWIRLCWICSISTWFNRKLHCD